KPRKGMAELNSTGGYKEHTVTLGSGLMDPSLTVCSLSAKTIAVHRASTLITCGALLLHRTLLTKAASPGSGTCIGLGASGELVFKKKERTVTSALMTTWTKQPRWLRLHERNCLVNSLGRGSHDKIQDRARK